jgi:hypothetical protein
LIIFQKRRQKKCILAKADGYSENRIIFNNVVAEEIQFENIDSTEEIEEIETEEVTSFLKSSRFHRRVFIQRVSCLKIRKLKRIIH